MRPILLDCDLNFPSDDFEALLLLVASSDAEIVACCAVAGNTWMEEVCINIRAALDLAGLPSIPVGRGEHWDLLGKLWGDVGSRHAWATDRKRSRTNPFIGAFEKSLVPRCSPELLVQLANRLRPATVAAAEAVQTHPGRLEILATGPLSNLADFFQSHPHLVGQVSQITIMGGFFGPASIGARPDFNLWFDPEAAQHVFSAGAPLTLVPLDVCKSARCDSDLLGSIDGARGGLADYFRDDFLGMAEQHGRDMPLYDQLVALVALDPTLVAHTEIGRVSVDTSMSKRRGRTEFIPDPAGNVTLITRVHVRAVHARLMASVSTLSSMAAVDGCPAWSERVL